ncbi:hypothetical protein BDF14DRAFT_1813654 [Spinellus fusiger]|nr:hypothetical protein BDF14DRAFT_1813654 [Spinellus fusiger]
MDLSFRSPMLKRYTYYYYINLGSTPKYVILMCMNTHSKVTHHGNHFTPRMMDMLRYIYCYISIFMMEKYTLLFKI